MSRDKGWYLAQAVFILAAGLGVGLLLISTRWGAGIGGDATIYISSARNLLHGPGLGLVGPRGEFRLLPYFPPFYPLVLSVLGLLGLEIVSAAHWLNMLLFAALVWLVGNVTYQFSRSLAWGMAAAMLLLFSPVLIPVYSWAMSEPLAIWLGFLGLLLLLNYLNGEDKRRVMVASAVITGLGLLTRYANLAFLLTGGILLLGFSAQAWRRRVIDALIYSAAGIAPLAAWVMYDLNQTATVASRSLESGIAERVAKLLPTLGEVFLFWIIPDSWAARLPATEILLPGVVLLGISGLALWGFLAVRGKRVASQSSQLDEGLRRLAIVLAVFSAVYLIVISAVYITTYPPITIASRMLSPVYIGVFWLAVLLAILSVRRMRQTSRLNQALLLGFTLFILWSGWRTVRIVQQNYELGIGFSAPVWRESPTLAAVQSLPKDTLIVTNEEMAVLYLTGRATYPLAEIYFD
ncbi:MAG: hypothetical protein U1B80_06120, partial [Anaerolineaceae bacterium]|nr:hypothetical protein [Anaerolineaceae bacterium]